MDRPFSRREFLGLVGAAAALPRAAFGAEPAQPPRPPNFVVILTDDQGYQDLGCYGSPDIATPRLDRMAAEGTRFTSFYSVAPVCTPSRAGLMTGCYAQRVSLPDVLFPALRIGIHADEVTLAELLKTRGYATACVGKWHLGHLPPFLPTRHGFDRYFGIPYSNDMSVDPRMAAADDVRWNQGMSLNAMRTERPRAGWAPLFRGEQVIEYPVDQATLTERYTEEAIRFITENQGRPFFLYLPHTMPHVPLHASERFRGGSKRGLYGDVIECIDWSTGQVLDTLARLGLDGQTLVVYTSDNGPWLSQRQNGGSALPLRDGKGTTYEGGMREPCLARWPGHIPAGRVCPELAAMFDLYPTLARLAGAELPRDRILDGRDIWPLLAGTQGARTPHDAFFYYRSNGLQAVRAGRWKLHLERTERRGKQPPVQRPRELYDLEADIGERTDLAAQHPDIVQRLEGLAARCREDIGDAHQNQRGANRRPCGTVPAQEP